MASYFFLFFEVKFNEKGKYYNNVNNIQKVKSAEGES